MAPMWTTFGPVASPSTISDPAGVAQRIADESLFPGALETDAAETLPRQRLDVLAAEGLYGLAGPAWAGGMEADLATICAVLEALASGCLTTAFVWSQHVTTAFVAGACRTPAIRASTAALCDGTVRAGLALAGSLPGPKPLRAFPVDGGWRLTGMCPWVSGWGRVDVLHTAAVTADGTVVWSLVDADEGPRLHVRRRPLVALNATATVDVEFSAAFVPDERVTVILAPDESATPDPATLRKHAALALGVTSRCCRLLGPTPLDDELATCRQELGTAGADTMPDARTTASELSVRAATALMISVGSRSLRHDQHSQRLAREALAVSVFAARSPVREAFLDRLGAHTPTGDA